MKCPSCQSGDVVRARDSGFTICYNCGCKELTANFLEIGDKIKRGDNGIYPVDDKELTYEEVLSANLPEKNAGQVPEMDKGEKYRKVITGRAANTGAITKYESVIVDVYDVLVAFKVTDPALQHLIKKALLAGNRGHKSEEDDLKEIVVSGIRALELKGYSHEFK